MSHTSVLEAAEARLNVPRSLFARWLVDTGRLTDALPGETPSVMLVPAVAPQTAGFAWGLWRHSRE